MALHPAAQMEMNLRQLQSHLLAVAPDNLRDARMAQHPALQRGHGG